MSECRLIYKSLSTDDFVSNETVKDIAEKGAANNKQQNITGLLVLSGNQFLQVLEGPTPEVNALFRKISGDERHTQVHLLHYELIQHRQFEDWSMRLVDLWDIPGSVREFIRSKYRCVEDIIQIPTDAMVVHALLLDARALSR
ncbi:MAG: BLUF domain-containing protein [Puniceicoccaceae bacterium]